MMPIKWKIRFQGRLFIHWLIFSAFVFVAENSFAGTPLEFTPDACFGYADFCFENGDFTAAADAYQQFMYFFPEDERVPLADYKMGLCDFFEKYYDRALNRFTRILDKNGLKGAGIDSAFMIHRCYQHMGDYPSAIDHLLYLKRLTGDPQITDKINYHLGWLYLEAGRFDGARHAFSAIRLPENHIQYQIRQIDEYLATGGSIPRKSPVAAGIFSIIPGGGYLYCGRYQDALVAFVVNSALMAGAWECFDEDIETLGGLMAALGVGFYAGNIYGGVSSAYKYNQAKQNEFVQRMKKNLSPELGLFLRDSAPGLALSLRF